jgi:hypothetical protein
MCTARYSTDLAMEKLNASQGDALRKIIDLNFLNIPEMNFDIGVTVRSGFSRVKVWNDEWNWRTLYRVKLVEKGEPLLSEPSDKNEGKKLCNFNGVQDLGYFD